MNARHLPQVLQRGLEPDFLTALEFRHLGHQAVCVVNTVDVATTTPDASGVAAGAGRRLVEYLQFATGHVSRRCKYKNIPPEWPLYPDGGVGRDPVCDVNLQIYQRDGWLVSRGCDKSGR